MIACQLAIGVQLSITVLLATANYVNEVSSLCKNYDWVGNGGKARRDGKVEATFNGARYEGIEPKGTGLVTLKADCGTSKLTSCALKDSYNNPVSADPTQRNGCSDRFKLQADDNSWKKCRLVCPFTLKPVVACEGFVADSICLTDAEAYQRTSVPVTKALVHNGRVSKDLGVRHEIEYYADCSKKEIQRCDMDVGGKWRTVKDAACNPFDDSGCTKRFDLLVEGETKQCRLCCFKYTSAALTCDD